MSRDCLSKNSPAYLTMKTQVLPEQLNNDSFSEPSDFSRHRVIFGVKSLVYNHLDIPFSNEVTKVMIAPSKLLIDISSKVIEISRRPT